MRQNAGATRPRSRAQGARPLVNGRNGMAWRSALRATVRPSFVSSRYATRNACANVCRHRTDDAVGESTEKTNDVKKGEALRQQRRHFVGIDGDECACGNGVVAPNGTTGQDGVDRQVKQARTMPAATAVGSGNGAAQTSHIASIPPHQRATDSHDYTRLVC